VRVTSLLAVPENRDMAESVRNDHPSFLQRGEDFHLLPTLKIVLACVAILGLLWGLYALRTILLLLFLSLLLSYLLEPIVRTFTRGRLQLGHLVLPLPRVPRLLTICFVYLFGLAAMTALSLVFLPIALKEGGSLIQSVPAYVTFLQETTDHLAALYNRYNLPTAWRPLVNTGLARGVQTVLSILQALVAELTTALSRAWWLLIPPLLAFFLLQDSGRLRSGFLAFFAQPEQRQRVAEMLEAIEGVLATFIRTQLALCVLMGLWIIGLLTLLRIPYGFLLGLLAAVLEFIPVFGPLLAGTIICLVAVVREPLLAVWVFLALVCLRVVQDYIVVPRVMGQHIHLHPAMIIVAVLCGAELAGTAGVFLATPVAAIIRVLLLTWQRARNSAMTPPASHPDEEPSLPVPSHPSPAD
jgi:predicted PurR-regulated permease PerM